MLGAVGNQVDDGPRSAAIDLEAGGGPSDSRTAGKRAARGVVRKSRIQTATRELCTETMAIETPPTQYHLGTSRWAVVRRPERDLLLAAGSGDLAALRRLFMTCRTDWYWYAAKHCRTCLIDETIQDALASVMREGHLAPRIAGVTRCLWLLARYAGWCVCAPLRADRNRRARQAIERISVLSGDDLCEEILLAMESLPAPELETLLLRDFDGLTIAELASALGSSHRTVRRRLSSARESMREYLTTSALSTEGAARRRSDSPIGGER